MIAIMVHRELLGLIGKCDVVYDDGDFIVLELGGSGRAAGLERKDGPPLRGAMIER